MRSPALSPTSTTRLPSTWTKLDAAILGFVTVADDKYEALALIIADGAFRHHQRVVYRATAHAHRHEHSRNETTIGIVEPRAGANAARAAVYSVVETVN